MSKAWSKACKEQAITTSRKDYRAQTKSGGTRHMASSQRHMHRWQGTSVETQTQTGSNRASMNVYEFYVQSNIHRDPKKGHPPPNRIGGFPQAAGSRNPERHPTVETGKALRIRGAISRRGWERYGISGMPSACRNRVGSKSRRCHLVAKSRNQIQMARGGI